MTFRNTLPDTNDQFFHEQEMLFKAIEFNDLDGVHQILSNPKKIIDLSEPYREFYWLDFAAKSGRSAILFYLYEHVKHLPELPSAHLLYSVCRCIDLIERIKMLIWMSKKEIDKKTKSFQKEHLDAYLGATISNNKTFRTLEC